MEAEEMVVLAAVSSVDTRYQFHLGPRNKTMFIAPQDYRSIVGIKVQAKNDSVVEDWD